MGPIIFFLFALVFTIAPITTINYINKVKRNGIRVKGQIEKIDVDDSSETTTTTLYIKFTTQSEIKIFEQYKFASKKYTVGQQCEISYLEQNPKKFVVVEDNYEIGYVIFSLIGLIMLIFSILLLADTF